MRVNFEMLPELALDGVEVAPLSAIRQRTPPPASGPHRDILNRLGYPFAGPGAAYLTAALSWSIAELDKGGVLARLDFLYLCTGTLATSVVDILGGVNATAVGATIRPDGALLTGEGGGFNRAFNPVKYQQTNAAVFAHLVEPPTSIDTTEPIITCPTGSEAVRLHRNTSSPYLQAKMNSSTIAALGMPVTPAIWAAGLYGLGRSPGEPDRTYVFKGAGAVAYADTPATTLPTSLGVGQSTGGHIARQALTLFAAGAYLTSTQREVLARVATVHARVLATAARRGLA